MADHGGAGRSGQRRTAACGSCRRLHLGNSVTFASVPVEACQAQQLRGVLHDLGATPVTPVTILSDGAEGPRFLGEIASVGPTRHVLDWFHLSMRIQHVAQTVKGWPDATAKDPREGAHLAGIVEQHIRWRLWHGQVERALDLIGDTLGSLDATAKAAASVAASAGKVADVLRWSGDLRGRARRPDNRLCDGSTLRGADLDSDHREHGAAAAAPTDERQSADAMVLTWGTPDAPSPGLGCERHVRPGQRR